MPECIGGKCTDGGQMSALGELFGRTGKGLESILQQHLLLLLVVVGPLLLLLLLVSAAAADD